MRRQAKTGAVLSNGRGILPLRSEYYSNPFQRLMPEPTFDLARYRSAVRFAVNLHQHHNQPLAIAYKAAVTQFRALRSEHQIANAFAAQEAEFYGAQFGPREVEVGFEQEREAIKSFLPTVQAAARHSNKLPWAAVWSMPGVSPPPEQWTRGEEYMQKVEKGVRPSYSPDLTGGSSFEAPRAIEQAADPTPVTADAVQAVAEPAVQSRQA